jgi:hypothetical protein
MASGERSPIIRRVRLVLADAYTFVRSQEVNAAVEELTLDHLLGDQIKRNGETALSNASEYDPYSFDPTKRVPAGSQPLARANFLGVSDLSAPTKLDRITALKNEISAVVDFVKTKTIKDVEVGQDLEEDLAVQDLTSEVDSE